MFSQIIPATPIAKSLTIIGVTEAADGYELYADTDGLDDDFVVTKLLFPNATKMKPPFQLLCHAVGKRIVSIEV
jgi:hypothetical protein